MANWVYPSAVAIPERVLTAQLSGGSVLHTEPYDTQGKGSVAFYGRLGNADPGNVLRLEQASSEFGPWFVTTLELVPTSDNAPYLFEVAFADKRFVRLQIDRGGADTPVTDVIAIGSKGSANPMRLPQGTAHVQGYTPKEVQ